MKPVAGWPSGPAAEPPTSSNYAWRHAGRRRLNASTRVLDGGRRAAPLPAREARHGLHQGTLAGRINVLVAAHFHEAQLSWTFCASVSAVRWFELALDPRTLARIRKQKGAPLPSERPRNSRYFLRVSATVVRGFLVAVDLGT